jgi:hypothetical protein
MLIYDLIICHPHHNERSIRWNFQSYIRLLGQHAFPNGLHAISEPHGMSVDRFNHSRGHHYSHHHHQKWNDDYHRGFSTYYNRDRDGVFISEQLLQQALLGVKMGFRAAVDMSF